MNQNSTKIAECMFNCQQILSSGEISHNCYSVKSKNSTLRKLFKNAFIVLSNPPLWDLVKYFTLNFSIVWYLTKYKNVLLECPVRNAIIASHTCHLRDWAEQELPTSCIVTPNHSTPKLPHTLSGLNIQFLAYARPLISREGNTCIF